MRKIIWCVTGALVTIFLLASCSVSYSGQRRFSGNWQDGLFIVDERSNDSIVLLVKEILKQRGMAPGRLMLHRLRYDTPLTDKNAKIACDAAGMVFAWNSPGSWQFACKRRLL